MRSRRGRAAASRNRDSASDGTPAARLPAGPTDCPTLYLRGRDAAFESNPAGLARRLPYTRKRSDATRPSRWICRSRRRLPPRRWTRLHAQESLLTARGDGACRARARRKSFGAAHVTGGTTHDAETGPPPEREFTRRHSDRAKQALPTNGTRRCSSRSPETGGIGGRCVVPASSIPSIKSIRGMTTKDREIRRHKIADDSPLPRSARSIRNHPARPPPGRSTSRATAAVPRLRESKRAQQLAPDNALDDQPRAVRLLCGDPAVQSRPGHSRAAAADRARGCYVAEVHVKLGRSIPPSRGSTERAGMASRMPLRIDSELKPLRADPRYRQLLNKQKMP